MTNEDHQTLAKVLYRLERQTDGLKEMSKAFELTGNKHMADSLSHTAEVIDEQIRDLQKLATNQST